MAYKESWFDDARKCCFASEKAVLITEGGEVNDPHPEARGGRIA